MAGCQFCGCPTSRRVCKQCELTERYDRTDGPVAETDGGEVNPETLVDCGNCETPTPVTELVDGPDGKAVCPRCSRGEGHREDLRADGGTVLACPECDSSNPRRRVPNKNVGAPGGTKKWTCPDCGASFDEVVRRPSHAGGEQRRGLAGKLKAADPDDLRADGGYPRGPRGGASHPDPDGRDDEQHYCDICDTPFETVVGLIKHDCADYREPVTDGGTDVDVDQISVEDLPNLPECKVTATADPAGLLRFEVTREYAVDLRDQLEANLAATAEGLVDVVFILDYPAYMSLTKGLAQLYKAAQADEIASKQIMAEPEEGEIAVSVAINESQIESSLQKNYAALKQYGRGRMYGQRFGVSQAGAQVLIEQLEAALDGHEEPLEAVKADGGDR